MKKLNSTAKLSFFNARRLKGDSNRIAEMTGFSPLHVRLSLRAKRTINSEIANAAFTISRRRMKTTEKLVNA